MSPFFAGKKRDFCRLRPLGWGGGDFGGHQSFSAGKKA
jgi:hypothetical protein